MKKTVYFAMILIPIAWGSTFPLSDYLFGEGIPVSLLLLFRFTLSFLVLYIMYPKRAKRLKPKARMNAMTIGVFLGLAYIFQNLSLANMPTSANVVLTSLTIVFVPLITFFVFKKKVKIGTIVASILGFTGVYLVTANISGEKVELFWVMIALAGALFYSLQSAMSGVKVRKNDPLAFTIWMFFSTTLTILLYSVIEFTTVDWSSVSITPIVVLIGVFLTVVCTVIPFVLRQWILKYKEPSQIILFFSTEILWATLISVMFFNEKIVGIQILGFIILFIGILTAEQVWKILLKKKKVVLPLQ